ncbi:MAG: glycerophosphodiester phosphodiesterase [Planctomycetaceae bacterium]|nr:glycerophosphodiester phosphodiesterase [Planctomycetales bacterium]MCB9925952.1 glycerophosphodiester phosphodiesterase [Planctomycetaceae bacterium]
MHKEAISIRIVLHDFRSNWRSLLATDLVCKAVAFTVLSPLVTFAFNTFLFLAGRSVLADTDIAFFLLHPIGWFTAIVVGGGMLAIFGFEQAALMSTVLGQIQGQHVGTIPALRFAASQGYGIFQITWRLVARVLIVVAPFAAIGGVIYRALLTQHDINFYLTEKPPTFWIAALLIGIVMVTMTGVLLRLIAGCAFALQLFLFDEMSPKECLTISQRYAAGDRPKIISWCFGWFGFNAVTSTVVTLGVAMIGQATVKFTLVSLWTAVFAVGVILLVWTVLGLLTNAVAAASLSIVLARLYATNAQRMASNSSFALPAGGSISSRVTKGRVAGALAVSCIAASGIGASAIHNVQLKDDVQITAHRGASGKAPENTLASVNQAIADRTDWVEVDVQESKDGVVVVAHDSDLKKVSGVDTKIWEATADELRSIDIGSYFDPRFADERVPTLAEVLDACRGRSKLNIELKYYGHDENLEQRVIELVEQHEMQGDIVLMSLEAKGIKKAKHLRPDWTMGLLTAVAVGDLTRAEADFFAVNTKLATPTFIQAAHRKHKKVAVWTVNDPVTMSVMISRGVDNIITDYPELARRVLAERATMSPVERLTLELAVYLGSTPANLLRGD